MKLTNLVTGIAGALVVGVVAVTLFIAQLASNVDQQIERSLDEGIDTLVTAEEIAVTVQDIKIDVIQVQQWLTDISATRGLDGLNDGFDEAAKYAQEFEQKLAIARALAQKFKADSVLTSLDNVEQAFGPFYRVGQTMAQGYIDGGPEVGNKLMPEFDGVAAAMGEAIDRMVDEIKTLTAAERDIVVAARDDVLAQQALRTNIDLLSHIGLALASLGIVAMFVVQLRKLGKVADVATQIAEGNLDAPKLGTSRWYELAALNKSIGVFRDNGFAMRAMNEEKEAMEARDREKRAEMMCELQAAFGDVVDGAAEGDFTQRVEAKFADDELNNLARGVNNLVSNVERGLRETGTVLAALAHTDLTLRVEGNYSGAFAKLKHDTNHVADRLTEVIGQLQVTSSALPQARFWRVPMI
ncbi:HAMP domain-containing protein [Maritalea mobilis]|uniref:HAMP domain-containing protein n=1 Tax=Maritalea mobilis TaxID=483324 RepID=UPI001FE4182F|nr:HAMP domain-containing protein [Maritalea mobilis]